MKTVSANQLTPNKTILVEGDVVFSRIASQIASDELTKDIERKNKLGIRPVNKPYTTITIENATVKTANPNGPSLEEQWALERLYTSQKQKGYCFQINNKSNRLPYLAKFNDATLSTITEINKLGELAAGQHVTLVLRVFHAPMNNGVSLDGVVVHNDPVWYSGGVGAGLAERGIVFVPLKEEDRIETPVMETPALEADVPAPEYESPYPAVAPVAPPVGNPYVSQPETQTAPGGIVYDPNRQY